MLMDEGRCKGEPSDSGTVVQLRARVAELESQLQRAGTRRKKIDKMSAEVVDSNPYRYNFIYIAMESFAGNCNSVFMIAVV